MALPLYLAMTAAELSVCCDLPEKPAYMACHFSAYSTGLSNFPDTLPDGAMLILNDRMPVQGHDPDMVAAQLADFIAAHQPEILLLDFQREGNPETARIAEAILSTGLPCPVGISEQYAEGLNCPVFLAAPPPQLPLPSYCKSWQGRELWLEAALDSQQITVTEAGASCSISTTQTALPFVDNKLHCHYGAKVTADAVVFTLQRTWEDLQAQLEEAAELGVTRAVGLYQQLHGR